MLRLEGVSGVADLLWSGVYPAPTLGSLEELLSKDPEHFLFLLGQLAGH